MPNTLTIAGLAELRAQLRNLPAHLAAEAGPIVTRHATRAKDAIVEGYPTGPTGNLKRGVKLDVIGVSGAGAVARVRSTAKHAVIFENGSQVRHTKTGANRGSMPPGRVFVPIVIRERKAMHEELVELVQREGLTVTGRGE